MNAKERIVWSLVVLFTSSLGYFVGQKSATQGYEDHVVTDVSIEGAAVLNEIDKSFGWAKAPEDMDVEVVDVVKGVRPAGDEYPYPMPAVKLSLKNIGDEDLESFGVNVVVLDEQGKRRIASYGQATGYIKQGWTTDKMLFDATETDWKDVIGNNKIDFPVTMVFYASVAGGDKNILRVVFEPWEIDNLPEVSH